MYADMDKYMEREGERTRRGARRWSPCSTASLRRRARGSTGFFSREREREIVRVRDREREYVCVSMIYMHVCTKCVIYMYIYICTHVCVYVYM